MTVVQSLVAFVAAAGVLTITPGIDTALVLRTAAVGGPRRAAMAALGICTGLLVWGAAAAVGLGALLAASRLAFTVVKWAGAAYLVWLGAKLLLKPRRSFAASEVGTETGPEPATAGLRRGLFTNLLNPKVGVFYVTFLPQFVPAGTDMAAFSFLLAVIHVALSLAWFAVLIAASVPLGRLLSQAGVMRALDRLTGGVFIGFGLRLALSQ